MRVGPLPSGVWPDCLSDRSSGVGHIEHPQRHSARQRLTSLGASMDYDPARDYQTGEARASASEQQTTEERRELPAAISATDAKTLVQQIVAVAWATRDKLTLRLPPRCLELEPGNLLELALTPGTWSVESCAIEGFVVIAELRPSWEPSPVVLADSGRIVANGDQVAGPVSIALLDVPALS